MRGNFISTEVTARKGQIMTGFMKNIDKLKELI